MLYIAKLLNHFLSDGEKSAEQALWYKYEMLYSGLMARTNRAGSTPQKGVALSRYLKNKADKETVLHYVEIYLQQINPEARAEALTAFYSCPYPGDPLPIIEDTKSNCEKPKVAAWRVLENIRHSLVREFAIENLQSDFESALPLFIKNYQGQDANLLKNFVKSIVVDFDNFTGWHSIHLDVLGTKKKQQLVITNAIINLNLTAR